MTPGSSIRDVAWHAAGMEMEFFALTGGAKSPDQAWVVAKSLTGRENVSWSSENGFGIRSIKRLGESRAFLNPAQPPAKASLDTFSYAQWRFWRHRATGELDGAVNRTAGAFLAADATTTAKDALGGLTQEFNTILDQFGRSVG